MGPFEITKDMVAQLSDEQLRSLLSHLLTAEAHSRGIVGPTISAGGNQTAADGGIDASIVWTGNPVSAGWLPRQRIYFQCKAETMAAAALTKEMRPEGQARPIFAELAAAQGSYIVFSTDDPSDLAYRNRLKAMRDAVADVDGSGDLHTDFYGADRIARWANEHLGVALWILEQRGRSMGGWRPYEPWSAPSTPGPYVFDETARAVVNGEEMDILSAIKAVRGILRDPGGAVRLVGISGMGKTRLAEALFDERIDAPSVLAPSRAIYGDLAQNPATGAAVIAEELVLGHADAVIVLDNTNVRTHAQIAQIVSRPGSRASVLSIDYDVGGERPTGTTIASLGNNSETVLEAVLEQRCPSLSQAERRHLAEFAGGNARVALKVAESSERGLDLSTLNDGELLDRLFQTGRHEIDIATRAAADAASLVYAFYVESGDGHEAEHAVLAEIAGMQRNDFFRNIATFLDWGVVQQRGPQRAVMPPPIANMLAARFIRRSEPSWLLGAFLSAPARLFASFARRLGQLHNEPTAVRLVEQLFAADGRLGDPASLDSIGLRAFLQAAPAAPDAALRAIERGLAGPNASRLCAASQSERREIVQMLAFIAYDPVHFARSMEALLAFALHDHGNGPDNQMREVFLERFWPLLSFTLADGATRLSVVDRLIDDSDERVHALAIEALDHMLDAGHFSSSLNVDFGARPRLTEWRPRGADYTSWLQAAFDRLAEIAQGASPDAPRAREIVSQHFREHLRWHSAILIAAMRAAKPIGYWDKGWRAVCEALHFDRNGLPPEVLSDAESLERELRPRNLEECFQSFVIGEPWRLYRPSGRERPFYRSAGLLSAAVGKRLSYSQSDLGSYLARSVLARGQSCVWMFGRGLAKHAVDIRPLWDAAYDAFAAAPVDARDSRVLSGILEGAASRNREWVDETLDAAVSDPALLPDLVSLHGGINLNVRSVERFTVALESGGINPDRFLSLMMGGMTKPIPAGALADFLRKLFSAEGGALTAIQVLHMRLFGDKSDGQEIDPALVQLCREFLCDPRTFGHDHEREDYDIAEIAKVALRGDGGFAAAVGVCRALRDAEGDERISLRDFDQTCREIMTAQPRAVLEEIVGTPTNDYLVGRFFGGYVRDDDDLIESRQSFDEQVALDWVREDPATRAPRLALFVPYAVPTESGAFTWGPFARALLELAPEPVAVLQAFGSRFWSGGGSGPISGRYVRRRPLIAEFANDPNPAIRAWARRARASLEEWIRVWDERDRDRDTRFE